MNPVSAPRPSRMNTASGSTSRLNQSQPASTTKFTASHPASLGSASFPIQNLTVKPARSGTAHASSATHTTTVTTRSLGRIALESPAAPVTSRRTPPIRRPIQKTHVGKTSPLRSATNTSAKVKFSRRTLRRAASFTKNWPPSPPVPPILRVSQPITSIIPTRSTPSFSSPNASALPRPKR